MLTFLLSNGLLDSLPYAKLEQFALREGDAEGDKRMLLRFTSRRRNVFHRVADVRIEGRNLYDLLSYIGAHRVAWIRELPAGWEVADNTAPVVTRIFVDAKGTEI